MLLVLDKLVDKEEGKLFMRKSMKVCKICDQPKQEGLQLFFAFICTDCEKEIIHTSPEEERYDYYVDRLKACSYQKQ